MASGVLHEVAFVPRDAPQFFAVSLVEGHHERAGFMIENQKKPVAVEQWRTAFTKPIPDLHLYA